MNKPEREDQENAHTDSAQPEDSNDMIEARIWRTLYDRASRMQFTPAQRAEVMQRLPSRRHFSIRNRVIPAFSLAAVMLLILSIATYVAITHVIHSPEQTISTIFETKQAFNTPPELAQGGQLVSLDPTGQHIVYGVANQAGVMYTANLLDPIKSNLLAMRDARDATWAPDGSAIVTTIYPQSTATPLLALVPTGSYMHTLGKEALAASWLPKSAQTISYITQVNGQATLWEIGSKGQNARVIGKMNLSLLAQHLSWSPNGRYLAILTSGDSILTREHLNGPSKAIYIFDTQTALISKLILAGDASVTTLLWSPDGSTLTYAISDSQKHTTVLAVNVSSQKILFTIAFKQQFMGMSWSPDGHALVYSDGGVLKSHVLHGSPIQFATIHTSAAYPLWQDNQHILYLAINNSAGKLTQLAESTSH